MAHWSFGNGGTTTPTPTKKKIAPAPVQPTPLKRTNVPIETTVPDAYIRQQYIPSSSASTAKTSYAGGYGSGSGGDGVGATTPAPVPAWSTTYSIDAAPVWWQGKTYSGQNESSNYASLVNAMIPYLSAEDQRTMSTYLYSNFKDAFPEYNPESVDFGAIPKISTEMQDVFTSKKRAQEALEAIDKMVTGSGKTAETYGAGYTFLRTLLDTLQDFGGESTENKQTREQVVQQLAALDPLLNSAKGDLAPYASLAQSLSTPFFSSGKVIPISKDSKGNYIFGEANKRWY